MCKITECGSPPLSPCGAAGLQVVRDQHDNRKRRVRFGTNVEHVFEKEFTEADHPAIWYTGEEFVAIKSSIYAMIRSVHNGCDDGSNVEGWHWRGFEHVRQRRPRKEIRKKHVKDLLYFQKVMGVMDPVDLGLLASSNSRDSSQRALDMGLLDQIEASEVYNETGDAVPDAGSVSESESDDEDLFLVDNRSRRASNTTCPIEGDEKMVQLLGGDMQRLPTPQDYSSFDLLISIPYQVALIVFPCLC